MLFEATPSASALQAARDTVVMYVAQDGLQTLATASQIVMGVFVLLLLPLALLLFAQLRKLNRTVRALGETGLEKADPILQRGTGIAENLEFISHTVRDDVERLAASVKALGERLQQASDHMEDRIEEFNALLEIVQEEAEGLFLDTAATVRGVRVGARTLGKAESDAEEGVEAREDRVPREQPPPRAEVEPADETPAPLD